MINPSSPILQLVHTLAYGDAISGEVLALKRCFDDLHIPNEIYAINIHPKLRGQAALLKELPACAEAQVILHYSLGSPLNAIYRERQFSGRALIYHNLTPARWFDAVNPRVAADIRQGLVELPDLCRRSDLLIADSQFNAGELAAHGFNAEVLELAIDPARWHEPPNSGIVELLAGRGSNLLHVGRLAPNKCVEDVIRIFYFVHHFLDPQCRLWLVGTDIDTEIYSFALKNLASQLHLDHAITFCGAMADCEVRALYENSDVYLCMSEHEGFCMPVIEAMHFGLPVLAYAASAIPDTVGNGGVLVSEKRHAEIAELVMKMARPGELRRSLIGAGRSRASSLSYEKFSARALEILRRPQAPEADVRSAVR